MNGIEVNDKKGLDRSIGGRMRKPLPAMSLTIICASVLLGILAAGLWPFHAPKNDVRWSNQGRGIFFGRHGSIVSSGKFETNLSPANSSCTLEVWLEPKRVRSSGTILAFYWPGRRFAPFALRQSLSDLKLERGGQSLSANKTRIYVDDVFSRAKPVLFTISSGTAGTAIYVDGALVKKSATFRVLNRDLTGELLVGNAPTTTDSWSGNVKGIAIYGRELSAAAVAQHLANWQTGWTSIPQPELTRSEAVLARYLFDERQGNVVRNQIDSATDLVIPERFFVLREPFLERPWDEFHSDSSYWQDVAVNIVGFIPLGFVFGAYLSLNGEIKRGATWLTIAFGFAVSLTIEVLQAFLPTRNSGMTDLVTNTGGTALGAFLYAWSLKQSWFARAGISHLLSAKDEHASLV